jgi:predicted O-methyltransferase YrrM
MSNNITNGHKAKRIRRQLRRAVLPLLDFILAPLVFLSAHILKRVRKTGVHKLPYCKRTLLSVGVFPILDYYYEPLFNPIHLKAPLSEPRPLPGIQWNDEIQLRLLDKFNHSMELDKIPREKPKEYAFYWDNGAYPPLDAQYWYNLVRLIKPARIIEIGSGKSTLLTSYAIQKNSNEDHPCDHVCIEPYAASWLEGAGIKVIRELVENVDPSIFASLSKNDILFIDSSHIIRPQGDVLFEYLELLPQLKPGVIVHIHDIFSPQDYPESWIISNVAFWNEQYLLEAFLSNNNEWQIIGALNYLNTTYNKELLKKLPHPDLGKPGQSFYIQKNSR